MGRQSPPLGFKPLCAAVAVWTLLLLLAFQVREGHAGSRGFTPRSGSRRCPHAITITPAASSVSPGDVLDVVITLASKWKPRRWRKAKHLLTLELPPNVYDANADANEQTGVVLWKVPKSRGQYRAQLAIDLCYPFPSTSNVSQITLKATIKPLYHKRVASCNNEQRITINVNNDVVQSMASSFDELCGLAGCRICNGDGSACLECDPGRTLVGGRCVCSPSYGAYTEGAVAGFPSGPPFPGSCGSKSYDSRLGTLPNSCNMSNILDARRLLVDPPGCKCLACPANHVSLGGPPETAACFNPVQSRQSLGLHLGMNCSISNPPVDSQNTTIATAVFQQIVQDLGGVPVIALGTLGGIDDVTVVPPVRALTYLATYDDNSTAATFATLFFGATVNFTGADVIAEALDAAINGVGFDPAASCAAWSGTLGLDLCQYVVVASGSSCELASLTASLLGDGGSGNLGSTFDGASFNILLAQMIGSGADFGRDSDIYGDGAGGLALVSPDGRRQLWYDRSSETYEERWLAAPEASSGHRKLFAESARKYLALSWSWFWRLFSGPVGWGIIAYEARQGTLPTSKNYIPTRVLAMDRAYNAKMAGTWNIPKYGYLSFERMKANRLAEGKAARQSRILSQQYTMKDLLGSGRLTTENNRASSLYHKTQTNQVSKTSSQILGEGAKGDFDGNKVKDASKVRTSSQQLMSRKPVVSGEKMFSNAMDRNSRGGIKFVDKNNKQVQKVLAKFMGGSSSKFDMHPSGASAHRVSFGDGCRRLSGGGRALVGSSCTLRRTVVRPKVTNQQLAVGIRGTQAVGTSVLGITGSVGNCLMTGLAIFSVVTQVIGLLVNAFSPPVYTPDIQLLLLQQLTDGMDQALRDLADIKEIVRDIQDSLRDLSAKVDQSICDTRSNNLVVIMDKVDYEYWPRYENVLTKTETMIRVIQRDGNATRVDQTIPAYIRAWAQDIAQDGQNGAYQLMLNLHNKLMKGTGTRLSDGTLYACAKARLSAWQQTPKSFINVVDDRPYYMEMQDWLLYMISYQTRAIRMIQDAYVVKAMDAVLERAQQIGEGLGAEKFMEPESFCTRASMSSEYSAMFAATEWCTKSEQHVKVIYDNMAAQLEALGNALSWGDKDDGVRLVLGTDVTNTKGKVADKTLSGDSKDLSDALVETFVPTQFLVAASPWAFDPNCTSPSVDDALQANCSIVGTWQSCEFGCGFDDAQEQRWEDLIIGLGYPSEMWFPADERVWGSLRAMVTARLDRGDSGEAADVLAWMERGDNMGGMTDRAYWVVNATSIAWVRDIAFVELRKKFDFANSKYNPKDLSGYTTGSEDKFSFFPHGMRYTEAQCLAVSNPLGKGDKGLLSGATGVHCNGLDFSNLFTRTCGESPYVQGPSFKFGSEQGYDYGYYQIDPAATTCAVELKEGLKAKLGPPSDGTSGKLVGKCSRHFGYLYVYDTIKYRYIAAPNGGYDLWADCHLYEDPWLTGAPVDVKSAEDDRRRTCSQFQYGMSGQSYYWVYGVRGLDFPNRDKACRSQFLYPFLGGPTEHSQTNPLSGDAAKLLDLKPLDQAARPSDSKTRPYFRLPALDINDIQCTPSPFVNAIPKIPRRGAFNASEERPRRSMVINELPTACGADLTTHVVGNIGSGYYQANIGASLAYLERLDNATDTVTCKAVLDMDANPYLVIKDVILVIREGPVFANESLEITGIEARPRWSSAEIALVENFNMTENATEAQYVYIPDILAALEEVPAPRQYPVTVSCMVNGIDVATTMPFTLHATAKVLTGDNLTTWQDFTYPFYPDPCTQAGCMSTVMEIPLPGFITVGPAPNWAAAGQREDVLHVLGGVPGENFIGQMMPSSSPSPDEVVNQNLTGLVEVLDADGFVVTARGDILIPGVSEELPPSINPEAVPSYVGCYSEESDFLDRTYVGGTTPVNFLGMHQQAVGQGKRLFAMARSTADDGFGFVFSLLNGTSEQTEGGCETPCADQSEKNCGCANSYNGCGSSRRFAVYDSWEGSPQLLRYRNYSAQPDPLLLSGTKLCPAPGSTVLLRDMIFKKLSGSFLHPVTEHLYTVDVVCGLLLRVEAGFGPNARVWVMTNLTEKAAFVQAPDEIEVQNVYLAADVDADKLYLAYGKQCGIYSVRLSNGNPLGWAVATRGGPLCGFGGDGQIASNGPNVGLSDDIRQIAVAPSTGDLYIADANNHRIRKVEKDSGLLSTVAGNGVPRSRAGNNGPARRASLWSPSGVAVVEMNGRTVLYIADTGNWAVRKVVLN